MVSGKESERRLETGVRRGHEESESDCSKTVTTAERSCASFRQQSSCCRVRSDWGSLDLTFPSVAGDGSMYALQPVMSAGGQKFFAMIPVPPPTAAAMPVDHMLVEQADTPVSDASVSSLPKEPLRPPHAAVPSESDSFFASVVLDAAEYSARLAEVLRRDREIGRLFQRFVSFGAEKLPLGQTSESEVDSGARLMQL